MPRKDLKARDKRDNNRPDPVFKSMIVTMFINKLVSEGKKSTAERIFYKAMEQIKKKANEEPLSTFTRALDNFRPLLEVKARRVGGATYQVPMEVTQERGTGLAMRWIIGYSREKTGKSMDVRLADEIVSASKKEGLSIKKREDTHKMAEANKAFAHYRW
jgi:small subunit ribosomal protein S7